ncbi:MAG: ATPase [marine bacterium B5-7]|nr:MAG: ATPase [marine bacterium B5-7]
MAAGIRLEERCTLERLFSSKQAEFLAIYGRRRVGKTYLIRSFFSQKKATFFMVTGAKDAPMQEQIEHVTEQIASVFLSGLMPGLAKDWNGVFKVLTEAMRLLPKGRKIILFFDELPWMATKNARLLQTLEYYWNQHWSADPRIKLIVCGSSASWIVDKIINSRGGLHNRVTETIQLETLNLYETNCYLKSRGITLRQDQVLKIYMAMGGIPYYLNKVEKGLTAIQLIEKLAFRKRSFFLDEFDNLFAALFDGHESYIEIITKIAERPYGINQEDLFAQLSTVQKGQGPLNKLNVLERSGFIMSFIPYGRKVKGKYYRVIDEYVLFYLRWIAPVKESLRKNGLKRGYWEKMQTTGAWYAWSGYVFENICHKHVMQISEALALNPAAIPHTWRYVPTKTQAEKGAQVDLLFDRDDNAITLCEIKYTAQPFKLDKAYAAILQQRSKIFAKQTRTKKQIFLALISVSGIKPSMYSEELLDQVVTLSDLFEKH